MNQWDKSYSFPIDIPENIKKKLYELFPSITEWIISEYKNDNNLMPYTFFHFTLGNNNCDQNEEYIEITLVEHEDGNIHRIRITRGSPHLVATIQKAFGIKFVLQNQSCELLDPTKYKGNWEPIDDVP